MMYGNISLSQPEIPENEFLQDEAFKRFVSNNEI
jgi:hypothetical protein